MTPEKGVLIDRRGLMLHTKALAYLVKHEADHMMLGQPPLLDRCITHLMDTCDVSRHTAELAALQALGERSSAAHGFYIDCDTTTSHVLHLVDSKSKKRYTLTVSELVEKLPGTD